MKNLFLQFAAYFASHQRSLSSLGRNRANMFYLLSESPFQHTLLWLEYIEATDSGTSSSGEVKKIRHI